MLAAALALTRASATVAQASAPQTETPPCRPCSTPITDRAVIEATFYSDQEAEDEAALHAQAGSPT